MTSLKVCKEYLNMATLKIPSLTPDKQLNILMY